MRDSCGVTHMTNKGRVTVPRAIRDYLGLKPRAGVVFERLPSGEVALRAANKCAAARAVIWTRLRGRATVRLSTEEIMALTRSG